MYDTWVAFVAASLLILIVPGPTLLVVVSYALRHGRSVIWPVAAAVSAGHALAISLAVWGLDALASLSAEFPSSAQIAASSYLAFLGIRQFRSRPTPRLGTLVPASVPGRNIFMHTATATALNPCSIGFFIAVTPQLAQASSAPSERLVLFGVTFVILAALNTTAYCLLADRMQTRLARPEWQIYLSRICGTALIGLSVWSFQAGMTG